MYSAREGRGTHCTLIRAQTEGRGGGGGGGGGGGFQSKVRRDERGHHYFLPSSMRHESTSEHNWLRYVKKEEKRERKKEKNKERKKGRSKNKGIKKIPDVQFT